MKTHCLTTMFGVFLLIFADRILAQPANIHSSQTESMKQFSGTRNDFEDLFHTKKLTASKGYPLKSAMAGVQKIDSSMWEDWDTIANQWVGNSKGLNAYDIYGNQTIQIAYSWNNTTSQFIPVYKATDYYSEHNLIPKIPVHIRFHPNPAKEFIVFDLTYYAEPIIVEIFDNQGKKVLEQNLPENRQISIRNLAKGLYLFRLNYNGNVSTGKIIVE